MVQPMLTKEPIPEPIRSMAPGRACLFLRCFSHGPGAHATVLEKKRCQYLFLIAASFFTTGNSAVPSAPSRAIRLFWQEVVLPILAQISSSRF